MVQHTEIIRCTTRYLNLKQKLNCKNYEIYVAECKNCNMQYVGQTKNKFLYVGLHTNRIGTILNLKKTMKKLPY